MSYYTSNYTNNHTAEADRKKKMEERKKAFKENKGNWEFNFFQKKYDPTLEGNIKLSMRPENGFNPNHVHHYINPSLSKEEQIVLKNKNGEVLKTNEQIILQNYLEKKAAAIKADIAAIKTQGLAAKTLTKEGRTRFLLHTLDHQLQKNNKDLVANIFLRLMEDDFEITPDIEKEYAKQIQQMNKIVKDLDLIDLQFNKFYSQMPPLNAKGFKKFDDWQIQVISNIDKNISTIVNAPTSAGKTVLAGYTITKGRVLFAVPTDALAWQVSAYIGNITNSNVPIITQTYQTHPTRDEMIESLNQSVAIVGTPESIVDYLPFIKNNFKWIVFDEIHMIGKPEGSAMEHIAKILSDVPILALSATIGNTEELVSWFNSITTIKDSPMKEVTCAKRFFNLQRYYYDPDGDRLVCLHPLALVEESQIANETILNKSLQPTPPNAWDLAIKLHKKFDIGDLEPHKYFSVEKRIELDDVMFYFHLLIKYIVEKYKTDKDLVMEVINGYKQEGLKTSSVDLIKLTFKLKQEDETPAIIFQKNTLACLRMAREFAKNIEQLETEKYPKLVSERLKLAKLARRMDKKKSSKDTDDSKSKKATKQMMGGIKLKKDGYNDPTLPTQVQQTIHVTSIQEPHPDFTLNNNQYFSEGIVESWVQDLKKYFPNTGEYYHFMIKLLWRGVGVYAKGLPDPYLRLVQSLACQKQLGVVFSDQSLVFGVSMPFRTVVIIRDDKLDDDLEPMMFHQMSGRAGRRGLDKKGNVVFAGYSWDRIKELSISEPPIVSGCNNTIYTVPHANQLSKLFETNQNWDNTCKNFLDKTIDAEDADEFLQSVTSNYKGGWNFGYIEDNVNHLHMNWKLRYTDDSLIASLLIPYLRRAFESKDHTIEKNQIQLAHFLCRFLSTKSTKNPAFALEDPEILSEQPYNQIVKQLDELQIEIPTMIDNHLFATIQQNTIVKYQSEDATDELRHQLFEFGEKIKNIQHFCFHSKITGLSKIIGKLLTRIWWIYHSSSPIMKSISSFDTDEFANVEDIEQSNTNDDEEDDEEYETDSDEQESDEEPEETEEPDNTEETEESE